jgi:putative photosynthetic complex assembly protein 2
MDALTIALVLFVWWFSTGAILFVVTLPDRWHRISVPVATGVAGLAAVGLVHVRDDATVTGAIAGFGLALVLWGWNELLFLTGRVTGPWRRPRPAGLAGRARFTCATATIIHHEVLVAATLLAVVAVSWGGANQVASATFFMLWVLRLSTKFNIFLGVPNPAADMLPARLAYLATFFERRWMNPLFPVSVVACAAALAWLLATGLQPAATPHDRAATLLLATLLTLGIIEHGLLLCPWPASTLWRWRRGRAEKAPREV